MRFSRERLVTATEPSQTYVAILKALDAEDWSSALDGIAAAQAWLSSASPGDVRLNAIVSRLVLLAAHKKWEIRRAVANVAAQTRHSAFEPALAKLATDDNGRVRQAAEQAALRRRDWANASTLGKQHEEHINATLDDIEARFGPRGRDAVKRASEQISNIFARELYHEVIKLISPLAASADRLRTRLSGGDATAVELDEEAARIESRVAHLRAVLDGMRSYTAQPKLVFERMQIRDVIDDAVALVQEADSTETPRRPAIELYVDAAVSAEVARARLVQAVTNLLFNAVESYDGVAAQKPIAVRVVSEEENVVISVEDSGGGMSAEALSDATVLFATSKPNGTGFGLPLAIKIVESEHGGKVRLESHKGRGTTVHVTIPAVRHRGHV